MGVEVVFVLIYPVALICTLAAGLFWLIAVRAERKFTKIGYVTGYVPLIVGFVVSMAGLVILAYIHRVENFTWLVEHGYYTDAQRPIYLPRRIEGQIILDLVFILPPISFAVIPCTVRLIRTRRLTFAAIALRAVIGWIVLSIVGWVFTLNFTPHGNLLYFMKISVIPILLYGLPVPFTALAIFHLKSKMSRSEAGPGEVQKS
jgi:hypothetical protein